MGFFAYSKKPWGGFLHALAVIVLLGIGTGCGGSHRETKTPTPTPTVVAVEQVDAAHSVSRRIAQKLDLVGTITSEATVTLSPQLAGKVIDVPVTLGSEVGRGQVVFRMDPSDIMAQMEMAQAKLEQARANLTQSQAAMRQAQATLAEAEAALGMKDGRLPSREKVPSVMKVKVIWDNARTNLERYQDLRKENLVSDQDVANAQKDELTAAADYQSALLAVDQSLAGLRAQQATIQGSMATVHASQAAVSESYAQLAQYQQQLSQTTVVSPVDGVVQQLNVTRGDFLAAGSVAAILVKMSPLYVSVDVPEAASRSLRKGQRLTLRVDGGSGREISCTLTQISPAVDPRTRTIRVKALISGGGHGLRAGMFARVTLFTGVSTDQLVVPQSAVLSAGDKASVFRLIRDQEKWTVQQVDVQVGQTVGSWIEVKGDVKAGQTVAVSNLGGLKDGQVVKVKAVPNPPFPDKAN